MNTTRNDTEQNGTPKIRAIISGEKRNATQIIYISKRPKSKDFGRFVYRALFNLSLERYTVFTCI